MVAIIRNDPYDNLIRKIGYSVGLEKILQRVTSLTELYIKARGTITLPMFEDLVEKDFDRDKKYYKHFTEFYGRLGLILLAGKELFPLYNLDSLAIMQRYFHDDPDAYMLCSKIILSMSILETDGDIFLNALAGNFENADFKALLEAMRKEKRERFYKVFQSSGIRKKIDFIIDIKSSSSKINNSDGSAGKTKPSIFDPRSQPLDSLLKRTQSLSEDQSVQSIITEDYLRKTTDTRKGWAQDLGLFDKSALSENGHNLLQVLGSDLHLKNPSGCFTFWPYSSDLMRLRITPKQIDVPDLNPWQFLCSIAKGIEKIEVEPYNPNVDYSDVLVLLKHFYTLYKQADASRGTIRHQLPLYIAEPCLVAHYTALKRAIPDFPEILKAEEIGKLRRIQKIAISGTEGALVFK